MYVSIKKYKKKFQKNCDILLFDKSFQYFPYYKHHRPKSDCTIAADYGLNLTHHNKPKSVDAIFLTIFILKSISDWTPD